MVDEVELPKEEGGEEEDVQKISDITLWRNPLATLYYFGWALAELLSNIFQWVKEHKLPIFLSVVGALLTYLLLSLDGPQQKYVGWFTKKLVWYGWWFVLGVLSSIGMGTGLHTFLLYLGPHIATVTMAAWECGSTDFPEPPYPATVLCPTEGQLVAVNLWLIIRKIQLESTVWGVGTAFGELPPYLMARAARLTGEEEESLTELKERGQEEKISWGDWFKLHLQELVQRAGFWGILLCAAVPNPLFDLAGITCGYLLIPISTFLPATIIGKAFFKIHLQITVVIILFTSNNMERLVEAIRSLPLVGEKLYKPCRQFLEEKKHSLHGTSNPSEDQVAPVLSIIFNVFIGIMIILFLVSIINGMAQSKYRAVSKDRCVYVKLS